MQGRLQQNTKLEDGLLWNSNKEKNRQIWKAGFEKLSESLTKEFGRGFSETNLYYARKFYLTYVNRISQTLFEEYAAKIPIRV